MFAAEGAGAGMDRDDVEAHGVTVEPMPSDVVLGRRHDTTPFVDVDALEGVDQPSRRPRPHLDENDRAPAQGNKVDLTTPAGVVALYDGEFAATQILLGGPLAGQSEFPTTPHGRPDYGPGRAAAKRRNKACRPTSERSLQPSASPFENGGLREICCNLQIPPPTPFPKGGRFRFGDGEIGGPQAPPQTTVAVVEPLNPLC